MRNSKTNGLADLSTALNDLVRDDKVIKQKIKRIIGDRVPAGCPQPVHYDYKSGAVYDGEAVELVKCGKGTFTWPNGDHYAGEYKDNQRHGFGEQVWNDGSLYVGHFENDKKMGDGIYKWPNKEVYSGTWSDGFRHGIGKYEWDGAFTYYGMFYENIREGYGELTYENGDVFKGIYKNDEKFGPGVLTYRDEDKTEDAGYWIADKLTRLLITFEIDFELPFTEPIDRLANVPSWYDREFLLDETLNPQNLFTMKLYPEITTHFLRNNPNVDKVLSNKIKLVNSFIKTCADPDIDLDTFRESKQITLPNPSTKFIDMFKWKERFSSFQMFANTVIKLPVEKFDSGERNFNKPGKLETASIDFLYAASIGDLEKMKQLQGLVDIDVCDNRGVNAFVIAVINCDYKVINFLLDNGANVNHMLDNGLTALMISIIRYYASDKFLPNTGLNHCDLQSAAKITRSPDGAKTVFGQSTKSDDFESSKSVIRYTLEVGHELVSKGANLLSTNEKIGRMKNEGHVRDKAAQLFLLNEISQIVELLLRRGADPALCTTPYPALCFAVAAGDIKIVKLLIEKGANCNHKMPKKYASLSPLCLACGVLGETGPQLVKLLLDSLANPNESTDVGLEYLSMVEEDWINEPVTEELAEYMTGRTPLHIACSKNDVYSAEIVQLLIDHNANPNLICNGFSPLSLAIASGNKEAVDILLKSGFCDLSLPLTNGVGSALSVICSTLYEPNWPVHERLRLINKLIDFGANIAQPIAYGPKRYVGTVVDYAYYMHNSDTRIAHTPYHSLTHAERETYNGRKELLNHLGNRFREQMQKAGRTSQKELNRKSWGPAIRLSRINRSYSATTDYRSTESPTKFDFNRKLQKWCYNCGRAVGVKLTACSRCKQVYYCSNMCKTTAWNAFHKIECVRYESTVGNQPNTKQENPHILSFVNQEHVSFLSDTLTKHLKELRLRRDNDKYVYYDQPYKPISFTYVDNKPKFDNSVSFRNPRDKALQANFAAKLLLLERNLEKKKQYEEMITKNPFYNRKENYSFN